MFGGSLMKTAVVYYSSHHGNTKKLLDAIALEGDVTLIDAVSVQEADLSGYDLIGFASGIYYWKFHESVVKFAERNLPEGKKVFLLCTYGVCKDSYFDELREITARKNGEITGTYGSLGFDTFGPFRLIGGIAKGRPNAEDLAGAAAFYRGLLNK